MHGQELSCGVFQGPYDYTSMVFTYFPSIVSICEAVAEVVGISRREKHYDK